MIQTSEVGVLNDSFRAAAWFLHSVSKSTVGMLKQGFLILLASKNTWHGLTQRSGGVWDVGSVSEWLQQCLAQWHDTKGADLRSAPAACVAASAQAPEWEILKPLNGWFFLICCDSAPVKQSELRGSLHVIAEAFLVLFKLKWLFTLQQRKRVLYPGMWAGNRWTMIFHQPVCCQSSDSHWQRS